MPETRSSLETYDNFDEDAYVSKMVKQGRELGLNGEKLFEFATNKATARRTLLYQEAEEKE